MISESTWFNLFDRSDMSRDNPYPKMMDSGIIDRICSALKMSEKMYNILKEFESTSFNIEPKGLCEVEVNIDTSDFQRHIIHEKIKEAFGFIEQVTPNEFNTYAHGAKLSISYLITY